MMKQCQDHLQYPGVLKELPGESIGHRHDGSRMLRVTFMTVVFLDIDTVDFEGTQYLYSTHSILSGATSICIYNYIDTTHALLKSSSLC
jgi:hypothetical protein